MMPASIAGSAFELLLHLLFVFFLGFVVGLFVFLAHLSMVLLLRHLLFPLLLILLLATHIVIFEAIVPAQLPHYLLL